MSMINIECLLGLRCNDFSMIAADQTNFVSILVLKDDQEKIHKISENLVMGVNGDSGDIAQFVPYITKNIQLYQFRNNYPLSIDAVVHFTRMTMANSLRKAEPIIVNLLFAGYDQEGGKLYSIDFLATCLKQSYAAHGYGSLLSLPILDQYYKPTMTEQEAYQVLSLCVTEIHQRFFIRLPNFQVCVVNKDGMKQMPAITG